jgi:hypothetical protein
MAGQLEIGDRVRFKARGLPDQRIGTPAGDHSWQEYLGGETGVVQAVDNVNGQVAVRSASHSQHGHPFLVWIAPEHLVRID